MSWTEQTNTTNSWTDYSSIVSPLLNSETSLTNNVFFLGGVTSWNEQNNISSSWSEVFDVTTISAGTAIGFLGYTYAEDVLLGPGSTEWGHVQNINTSWSDI